MCVTVWLEQAMLNSEEGLDNEERTRRRAERRRAKKKVSKKNTLTDMTKHKAHKLQLQK